MIKDAGQQEPATMVGEGHDLAALLARVLPDHLVEADVPLTSLVRIPPKAQEKLPSGSITRFERMQVDATVRTRDENLVAVVVQARRGDIVETELLRAVNVALAAQGGDLITISKEASFTEQRLREMLWVYGLVKSP